MNQPATKERFASAYERTPPWDIGRPQQDLVAAFDALDLPGPVLDLGCGTGEHVLELARRGIEAWGLDATVAAVEAARAKADERGVATATFVVGDALDLSPYRGRFRVILDCGLYHVIRDSERRTYVAEVTRALAPGGWHLMLGFQTNTTGFGPRGYSPSELRSAFSSGWRERFLREATFEANGASLRDGTGPPRRPDGRPGVAAWLSLFERT